MSTLLISHVSQRIDDTFWQQLMKQPYQYDLFQILRRIDAQAGSRFIIGKSPSPKQELLRLGQTPSLSFAPSTLSEVDPIGNATQYQLSIFSFGLFGPNGPLPLHLTEYVRERLFHHQDRTWLDFSNLFHHRLIQLFYRAWADAQPTVSLDRPDNQTFNRYFGSMIGLQFGEQPLKDHINLHAKYFMAGHLSRNRRNAEGLGKILSYYFNIPVKIIENIPIWLQVPVDQQSRLKPGRHQPRLGLNSFLGIAVRDIQHKFRLELGPLSRETYLAFLPGGTLANALKDWVRQYVGIEFIWDIRLIMRQNEVHPTALNGEQRLGFTSWLHPGSYPHDGEDLVYHLEPLENQFSYDNRI